MRAQAMARGQAEHLIPMVQEVMGECACPYDALHAVAVLSGPGAFTGVRIALSAARALGISLDIPVYGMTTTQALALAFVRQEHKPCTVVIETKRTDFYMQKFDANGHALGDPCALLAEDLAALMDRGDIVIGDGAARFLESAGAHDFSYVAGFDVPDMVMVAERLCAPETRAAFFVLDPAPVYLRGADVSFSTKPQRILEA